MKTRTKKIMNLRTTTALVFCLGTFVGTSGAEESLSLTDAERKLNLESFEHVWTTVRDRHYDPTFGGLDWQAVHDELRPQSECASTTSEAREIMEGMIRRLDLTHFSIIPSDLFLKMQPTETNNLRGITGMEARVINGHALVTKVKTASAADRAGIRTGWEIVRVKDEAIAELLLEINQEYEDRPRKTTALSGTIQQMLRGSTGDSLSVQFRAASGQIVDKHLELHPESGQIYQIGHLPPIPVSFEASMLEPNIGYITFNQFLDPARVMPAFNLALKDFINIKATGIIIDLRGNTGGMAPMAMGMAGWLVHGDSEYLGTMYFRNSELKCVVWPRAKVFTGPVAVLVDELSMSCSEMFAGGLQDLGRARVVGVKTPGAALPSELHRLPNGDGFQFAFANYRSKNGEVLEGNGVTPDTEVNHTQADLLQQRDSILTAAIDWIITAQN